MKFDNIADYHSRYNGTFVVFQNSVCRVINVEGRSVDEARFVLENEDGDVESVSVLSPDLRLDNFAEGYFNVDGRLLYAQRAPQRQWKQGFNLSRMFTTIVSSTKNALDGRKVNGCFSYAKQLLLPEFQSFKDFKRGTAGIVSDKIAVDSEGFVYFRGLCYGFLQDGKLFITEEGSRLRDTFHRENIETEQIQLKRATLGARVSVKDLILRGIDVANLQELLPVGDVELAKKGFEIPFPKHLEW